MSEAKQDAAAAEQQAEAESSRLAGTAKALRRKLTLGSLIDEILGSRGRSGALGTRLSRTIRHNPIPATLLSIGLIWLIASGSGKDRGRGATNEEDELDARPHTSSSSGETGEDRQATNDQDLGGEVRVSDEAAEEVNEQPPVRSRHGASRARGGLERLIEEQPLVVGALALALGAAIGGALPNSRTENRLMGRQAARLRKEVRDSVEEEGAKLHSVAKAAGDEAHDIVDEFVEEVDRRTPTVEQVVDKVEAEATKVARRLAEAAEEEAVRVKLGQSGAKPPAKDDPG